MSIIDDAAAQYQRVAKLLGGSGTYNNASSTPVTAPATTAPPMTPPSNPSYATGASPEAAEYMRTSGMAGPTQAASPAVAPRNVQLPGAIQRGINAASDAFSAQVPSMPTGDGFIARAGRAVLGKAGALAGKLAPVVEPAVEGARVAQVALDPNMTKADVAQQAVEGATRWGSTVAGSSLGAGIGAVAGGGVADPVTVPVGAIIGGIGGYLGGDALVNKVRSMVGLGDKSPSQRSSDALAATAKAATPAAAAANVIPGANGSTVQVNPDGSAQLASRPTTPAPAAASPIAAAARAAAPKRQRTAASPVAAAAAPQAAAPNVDDQINALQQQQDALGLTAQPLDTSRYVGVTNPTMFTDSSGRTFTNAPEGDAQKALRNNVSIIDAQGQTGDTFTQDGKQYRNIAIGTDNTGMPLVKAFSVGGKGVDDQASAINLYRQMADLHNTYGTTTMPSDQADKVKQYMDLDQQMKALRSQGQTGYDLYQGGQGYRVGFDNGIPVPMAAATTGQSGQYIANMANAQVRDADPLAKELAKQQLVNEGSLADAKVHAGATMGAAGISAAASKYAADLQSQAAKKNIVIQDETVDDGMGGTKIVHRAYNASTGEPLGVQNQGTGKNPGGFVEGQVYVDPVSKTKAIYRNGKWEATK